MSRKQKFPVALVTVFVIAGLGLAISSKQFGNYTKSQEELQKQAMEEAQEAMKAQEVKDPDVTKVDNKSEEMAMKAQLKKSRNPKSPEGEDDGPTVVMPEQKEYMPKPNDAATSSLWYN